MAEQEIDAVSDTYEDQHQKSNEHNPVKVLHEYHQLLLVLAFGTSVSLQAFLLSQGMMGFQTALADFRKLVSFMGLMNSIVWMCSRKSKLAGLETYFGAFALVLEDYVLLTTLNKRYIEMIIIPIMILCFIAAIGYSLGMQPKLATQNEYQSGEISSEEEKQSEYQNEDVLSEKGTQREHQNEEILSEKDTQSEYQNEDVLSEKGTKRKHQNKEILSEKDTKSEYQNEDVLSEKYTQREHQNKDILSEKHTQSEYQNESEEEPIQKDTQWELIQIAMVPYFMQLSLGVWIQYKRQLEDGIFIVSNFVLFFSSALCALTVMMASPPIGLTPGVVAEVLPVMHKSCIIMLMMTGHTMAAEWLREDIVFVCMPELAAVLAWFTIYFLHPDHGVGIKVATSHRSRFITLCSVGAILVCLDSFNEEDRISWLRRVLCICSASSALCFLHQWLLNQWPANTPDSTGLDQLLKFSSEISLYVAISMLCFDQQILHEALAAAKFRFTSPLMQHLLLTFAEKMEELKSEAFWSMLVILLTLVTIYFRDIPGKGVEWHQRLQIKNKRRPRLTHVIGVLQSMVDAVDKRFGKLTFLDLPFIPVKLNGIVYWTHFFAEQHVDASNADARTAHDPEMGWFVYATQHHDAEVIHEVQSGFDKVTDEVTEYMLPPAVNPQLTGLYADSGSLDEQKKNYLEKILVGAGSDERELVCILPRANVEKRELALKVCERIEREFGCYVSVSADRKPDMAKLIMDMIKKVGSEYIGTGGAGNVYQLSQSRKQLLQNKRYLVMIDDLCSYDQWMTIESCFPDNNLGSRIIITTRFEDATKAGDLFYWIPLPNETDVETLFSRKISGSMSGVVAIKPSTKDACEQSGLQETFIKVIYNQWRFYWLAVGSADPTGFRETSLQILFTYCRL